MKMLLRAPLQPMEITDELRRVFDIVDEGDGFASVADAIEVAITKGDIGLPSEMMDRLPNLKLIAVYGVGTDAVDLPTIKQRGIHVTTTPGVLTDAVAEMALALLFSAARNIATGDRFIRDGKWVERKLGLGWSVFGETVGILGYGRIGRRVGTLCKNLGMKVLYTDLEATPGEEAAFRPNAKDLAQESRIMIITAAGGNGTDGLVNAEIMTALGKDGLLINVARGSVVNEADLITCLTTGKLGAAALDVFSNEPNIDPALLSLPNLLVTPHIASATINARIAMGHLVIDNVTAFAQGRALITPLDI